MKRMLCGTFLSGIFLAAAAQAGLNLELPDINVPDLGDPASSALSTTEESMLGVKLIRELRGKQPVVEDPELSEWIRALGNRLAIHAPGHQGGFYFLIVKNPEINAYAMPGGVIVIHSGLILNTQSESELAAVVAHEIAHVTQRHVARMLSEGKSNPLVTGLGVLAGAAAASKSSDAAQAIITSTIAMQAHNQLAFSRQMETEADRIGLRALADSGFDPRAMPFFLEKLDRRTSDLYGDISKYLRTHPLDIDRLSDARTRASQLGKRTAREDVDYLYAREKLRVLVQPSAQPATSQNPQVNQYAQALRQLRGGNAQAALQILGTQSRQLPVALAIAEALNSLRRYPDTEKLLMPLASLYPGQESILIPLAKALLAQNKAAQAWQLFNRSTLSEQSSLEFLEMRQQVAEQAGEAAEAYRTAAERSLRMGEYRHARAVLEQASRLPGASAYTTARMQAMIQEIQRFEKKSKQLDKF